MNAKPWIEAMRLRTLPVSAAGVLAGCAVALAYNNFNWLPALICLVFALAAQIVSNFANEYFDFKNGLDHKGRQGFRRGVTEGDITPESMKRAMTALLAADCLLGLTLIHWGGFWLIAVGILIAIAAFAYSAGPWPLSHHGLGDEAVVVFYGIVPVTLTAYLQCGDWTGGSMAASLGDMWKMAVIVSLGVGLLGANVLTVNNVRDVRDDARVGKRTKAVIFGPKAMKASYIICAYLGLGLIWFGMRNALNSWGWAGYVAVGIWMVPVIIALFKFSDYRLNKVLRYTALLLLAAIVWTIADVLMNYDSLQSALSQVYLDPFYAIY
ncbi:MAG: 1,4-dihydroxy-2-naphthoate octaprenyltransferase [Muribaculaceae bacterium]|nr:1,4-dihydroxy-2-naphthoate octaprenyltransferase [Muribaculaceae bacterium]MDE6192556.1 1,4-dihydroxy-2-naphthoate octaprenyltransferase [Muribaculaceae bacterium]